MTQNKKPALIVAIVLGALILISLLLLLVSRLGGGAPPSSSAGGTSSDLVREQGEGTVPDFDLRKLAEKAERLIEQDLAEALRKGDISLEFMADLKRESDRAKGALNKGKLDRATELYTQVVTTAEAQLEALALADKARALSESTYIELQAAEYLQSGFENTYREAVETYNAALRALNLGQYQSSVDDFEMTSAILGDLEARAIAQIATMLEVGNQALANYELTAARTAYDAVLKIDQAQAEATEGLVMVAALEGIAEEVKYIRSLEDRGELEAALSELERLAANNPQNPFIKNQRASLEARIVERDFEKLVAASVLAEEAGDYATAIAQLETALKMKSSAEQAARLAELKEAYKAVRLEQLLANGYDALKSGRYGDARDIYKEAIALAPESKEARTGLEKSSSLYLANIRYSQNMTAAAKYIKEGRYPLAAKLFNEAMTSRPGNVVAAQEAEESRIRTVLEAQSEEVAVTIRSDKRTYVSIIGVLPPDRFKEKDLKLYPDVYKVRGTRKGYESVEIELKVDTKLTNQTITVKCTEKI